MLTYGAETWTLTQESVYRLRVAQRAMERSMLGIKLVDRVPNPEIRRRLKVVHIGNRIMELKWSWAGHLVRRGDGRWSKALTEWRPSTGKRSVGQPVARWAKDIVAIAARYILDEAGTGTWNLAQTKGLCPAVGEVGLWMMMMVSLL